MKCKNCNNLGAVIDIADFQEKKYPWCFTKNDCPDIEIERDCDKYECMTNADKIRKMTDEELAVFLAEGIGSQYCSECQEPENEYGECIGECKNEFLRWLQKEVE